MTTLKPCIWAIGFIAIAQSSTLYATIRDGNDQHDPEVAALEEINFDNLSNESFFSKTIKSVEFSATVDMLTIQEAFKGGIYGDEVQSLQNVGQRAPGNLTMKFLEPVNTVGFIFGGTTSEWSIEVKDPFGSLLESGTLLVVGDRVQYPIVTSPTPIGSIVLTENASAGDGDWAKVDFVRYGIPEPSTIVLAAIAGICFLFGCVSASRKKR